MISILLSAVFAQAQPAAQGDPNGFLRLMLYVAGIMGLFYFMLIRPQKQKEQQLRQLVYNLKENDRVITIGGIYGVVTNVQREADRVTIRVDEGTGTKLRVNMSAIARVLTGDEKDDGTTGSTKSS